MNNLILSRAGALLCLVWLAVICALAPAEPLDVALLRELCAETGGAEGRYHNVAAETRLVIKNVYLVCAGFDRISATFLMGPHQDTAINLHNLALDGDKLTFTTIKLGTGREISGHSLPAVRLEVSYSALKQGLLVGTYRSAMQFRPIPVIAKRDQTFPNPWAESDRSADRLDWDETYVIEKAKFADIKLEYPAYLSVDVIGGLQRITFNDSKEFVFTMYAGMSARGAGRAFAASSGVSDDAPLLPLLHIRGRMISPSRIEFYYFNTMYGMLGPYHAEREAKMQARP